MKKFKIFIPVLVLAIALCSFNNDKAKPVNKCFAVVELFTSEGCSSCPPADAVVAKLQKENAGKPVYILAFHVDYWDNLGWKDSFSDAAYSKRQRDYARYLKISSVYTPQIVVNGKTEFVGSEEGDLHKALSVALAKDAPSELSINAQISGNTAQVHYDVKNNGDRSVFLLALVKKTGQSIVKAGENKGRTLSHVQIVQHLQSASLSPNKSGVEKMSLPKDIENYEIIALVQSTVNGEILAAARTNIGNTASKNAE